MANTGRKATSPYGIEDILEDLSFGDEVVFEAGGWERKQPLKVRDNMKSADAQPNYVTVVSNRATEYDLVYSGHREPFIPDQGPISWIEVVG